jgi:tRNA pseudouridine55 synthase
MDGLLVVDKPSGPTSHDVVARMRRALRETRIGHTGTLDPMATGVLLLVVGKATRLAKFLTASDKSYDAVVRFGFATDSADAQGRPLGPASDRPMPSREAIEAALDAFRGTFLQQPPAFSAKKIGGQRSYKLARDARLKRSSLDEARDDPEHVEGSRHENAAPRDPAALPAPASVTLHAIRVVSQDGDHVTLSLDCSAGFYVRSLAHDLGERLGVGGHLAALRRTRTGDFGLDRALTLDAAQADPPRAVDAMVPLAEMLPALPSVILTTDGVTRVGRGQDIRPCDQQLSSHNAQRGAAGPEPLAISHQPFVRLLDARGDLLAIAEATSAGLLHPSVVLV